MNTATKHHQSEIWETKCEIEYIKSIGMHRQNSPKLNRRHSPAQQIDTTLNMINLKVRLLDNYLISVEKRDTWFDGADVPKLIETAREERTFFFKQQSDYHKAPKAMEAQ